ncbi:MULTISPECIES: peroxide stress protein YaaA [unclassified Caulobacter]|uniref:peroxide stress protein YaaA n=1 Tax=unclassified Caulobacter TaxID=2648921 RepID=UPI000D3326B1|nr:MULTISPECIES: peroxide stress protein YaaA [unclassified Caulobacter]PTS88550.1 peroxide stress protein YaaA [Caulobacter sp. HMWF009]PTT09679.1 peroxide stress protein YaaA [Caulobacter sp. HMWF025]PTT81839.1 peroxide stress protein YaaA [Pseudomonas sp. HMWF010]
MLMVISPAKSLDFTAPEQVLPLTTPELKGRIAELAKVTHKLTVADLRRLMHISEKLAVLNRERFQHFDPEVEEGLQAVIAFNGDVYAGLAARELDRPALDWAQDHLRILSGLYGVLRPLDAMQPYRLEMGTRLKTKRGANLYDFWGETIAKTLNAAAEGHADPALINLASQEYFGAVDARALKLPVITCHFKEEKAGALKVLGFFAKKARGRMARFIIDNRLERSGDMKSFDLDGYRFRPELSTGSDWVFARPQP